MDIDFANLQVQYQKYKDDIDKSIKSVLDKSNYIMGEKIDELEIELKNFTGSNNSITCSSGTDALLLALMAIDIKPGDEVITTPYSFISTAETIALLKAKPVFVDIEPDTFNIDANLIEKEISNKTKAIIPVSLFGQPSDLNLIQEIANKYNLKVIIDGAQSFGSKYFEQRDSNLGDISITSFFPSKPLGCYGDGGAIFTNNDEYAAKIKMLRLHGQNKKYQHKYIGIGGRLDTIQAAILLAKLPYFNRELLAREKVAYRYTQTLSNYLQTPKIKPNRFSSWAQYTIRAKNRDNLQSILKDCGIPTAIYYPIPLYMQECFQYLKYKKGDFPISEKASKEALSLPMNSFLTNDQIDYVTSKIKEKIS